MSNLIKIDFEKGRLKTPNHTYYIKDSLSIDRYIEFELLQAPAAYGMTFSDIYTQDEQVLLLFNKGNMAEAISVIVNRRQAMKNMSIPTNSAGLKVDKRHHGILQIAALFLVEKDEDTKTFKQEVNDEKIQDFLESGVDYKDLFMLVVKLVPGLLTALEEVSRITSLAEAVMNEAKTELNKPSNDKEK